MRSFADLTEREILALAISNEEEDGRIYADFAESLREEYPDSARVFDDMAEEESEHRRMLIDNYVQRFGDHIPLVRRQDVRGGMTERTFAIKAGGKSLSLSTYWTREGKLAQYLITPDQ